MLRFRSNRFLQSLLGFTLVFSFCCAHSMNLIDASYDASADELVLRIAYRGTHPDHTFTVSWERCRVMNDGHQEILGIIMDSDPRDPAELEFQRTERISLQGFACRPAIIAVGLASPLYRRTLAIPARIP
jgi:hypothetical protein